MKRFVLLVGMLLLAACGPAAETAPPAAVEEPSAPEVGASAPAMSEPAAPETAVGDAGRTFTPGTTPAEAAVVRPTDWTLGSETPVVSIIEYGDFQ